MKKFSEKTERSMLKAVTFRVLIVVFDSATILYITKRLDLTLHVVAVSTIIHTVLYFLHDASC